MQFCDRAALLRIGIGLAVVVLLVGLTVIYMCRCFGRSSRVLPAQPISVGRLREHIEKLCGELGEHNWLYPDKLHRAADYIDGVWRDQGYSVVRYPYTVEGIECTNLEITRAGATRANEIVLIGAHYDSVDGSPGANDNGSGVAALLELSRVLARLNPACSVRFVAFVNEEPPHFETDQQGSRVYAKICRQRGDDIRVMIALETIGYFSDEPGSQRYPRPFSFFYPDRGNFIGFVSNIQSRRLMHQAVRAFRGHSDVPVECCATFERIEGVNWSDHASFWHEAYPAFMVTDTAPFRYPYYHSAGDTPDKVNYAMLSRVTDGLCGMVVSMAGGATVDLNSLWDYDNPAESERRFRALPPDGEVLTQIARAQGLQRKFDDAHRTLDAVVTNLPRVEVRYLLERGRVFNSAGFPDKAKPFFLAAWQKALAARLEFFAVDAAHMLGIVESTDEALAWNEKAVALAEKSLDPKTRDWLGSLLNNVAWTYYDKREYAKALATFEHDLVWFTERNKQKEARIARYSIGKSKRALGQFAEALAIQQELANLLPDDGFVEEEIAECLLALGKPSEAKLHFARAYELLSNDQWLAAEEPKRLERLKQLAQDQPVDERR